MARWQHSVTARLIVNRLRAAHLLSFLVKRNVGEREFDAPTDDLVQLVPLLVERADLVEVVVGWAGRHQRSRRLRQTGHVGHLVLHTRTHKRVSGQYNNNDVFIVPPPTDWTRRPSCPAHTGTRKRVSGQHNDVFIRGSVVSIIIIMMCLSCRLWQTGHVGHLVLHTRTRKRFSGQHNDTFIFIAPYP